MIAAPRDDQRPLRRIHHLDGAPRLRPRRRRLVNRQRLIGFDVEFDLAVCTSIGRSIRTGPGRPDRITWKACWKTIGTSAGSRTVTAHLATGLAIDFDIDGLEIFFVKSGSWRLAMMQRIGIESAAAA